MALLNGHWTGISELYLPGGVRGHMFEQTVGTDCKGTLWRPHLPATAHGG